jgi:hypothetical protein
VFVFYVGIRVWVYVPVIVFNVGMCVWVYVPVFVFYVGMRVQLCMYGRLCVCV